MPDDRQAGQLKRLRRWLGDNPEGDLRDLYAAFGGAEIKVTLDALDYLEERGEITIAPGEYRYGRKHGLDGRETKQTAIYSTLRNLAKVCRVVAPEKVIQIAEVDESYARRYFAYLAGLGYIERRPSGWAVLEKAMKQPQAPQYNQRQERRKVMAENREEES